MTRQHGNKERNLTKLLKPGCLCALKRNITVTYETDTNPPHPYYGLIHFKNISGPILLLEYREKINDHVLTFLYDDRVHTYAFPRGTLHESLELLREATK
jgi:hypothetical protein